MGRVLIANSMLYIFLRTKQHVSVQAKNKLLADFLKEFKMTKSIFFQRRSLSLSGWKKKKRRRRRRRKNDSSARMTAHNQMGQELNGNTELENDSDKFSSILTQPCGPSNSLNKYANVKMFKCFKRQGRGFL